MPTLVDTSLWIDFTRPRTPVSLKKFIAPYVLDPDAHIADPIRFEVLRNATPQETRQLERHFQTFPVLADPPDLWTAAASLGQQTRHKGVTIGALDLLIATIALHHGATLITFDDDFQKISAFSNLQVKLLQRPSP
jgi:hypothetical protein